MSGEVLAALPNMCIPDVSDLLEAVSDPALAINSRTSGRVERSDRRAKLVPVLAGFCQAAHAEQTPEALLSNYRQSILSSQSSEQAPNTIVTALLSLYHPLAIAAQHASTLMDKFGSIGGILRKSAEDISRVCPLSVEAVFLLKVVHSAIATALREPIENRPIIGDMTALEAYLKFTLLNEEVETVRTLFLNRRNILLKDELHATGSIAGVQVSIRNVVQRVLDVRATGLIIVHNHPSGDPMPSEEDIAFTRQLRHALGMFEVTLHDHVIVGRHRAYSFKAAELLWLSRTLRGSERSSATDKALMSEADFGLGWLRVSCLTQSDRQPLFRQKDQLSTA